MGYENRWCASEKTTHTQDEYEVKSEYNAFNQPISIERLNAGKYFFEYNTFQNRSDAFYGNDLETNRYNLFHSFETLVY
jgi:hypothetical protein